MATQRKFLEQRLSTLLQEKGPLDEFQQEEVVQTMATLQSYHDTCWTRSFSAISLLLSVGYFVDAGLQVLYPFATKHRGLWQPFLSSSALILCEVVFGVCLFFCCLAVFLRGRRPKDGLLWTPMSLTLICCSLFSFYMISCAVSGGTARQMAWLRVDLLWMPVLPIFYCLLNYYVISLLDHTFKGVEQLKDTKYAFKAV